VTALALAFDEAGQVIEVGPLFASGLFGERAGVLVKEG
jgi:hypothetical protein